MNESALNQICLHEYSLAYLTFLTPNLMVILQFSKLRTNPLILASYINIHKSIVYTQAAYCRVLELRLKNNTKLQIP
jgi:hypothetical protein